LSVVIIVNHLPLTLLLLRQSDIVSLSLSHQQKP